MKVLENTNPEIKKFLEGRAYLLSERYCWINGKDEVIAIQSMDAYYQINCMNWLLISLKELQSCEQETKITLEPLIKEKMDEFIEGFLNVLNKENSVERSHLIQKYLDYKSEFEKITYKKK